MVSLACMTDTFITEIMETIFTIRQIYISSYIFKLYYFYNPETDEMPHLIGSIIIILKERTETNFPSNITIEVTTSCNCNPISMEAEACVFVKQGI